MKLSKKTVYDKLAATFNAIDTSEFVLKNVYDMDKSDLEKKIIEANKKVPDASRLVKNTDHNGKNIEIIGKIPSINGLATASALTTVENKIPDAINLLMKADYDAKISDIESKYFTTTDHNKFTSQTLDAKIKQKELVINLILLDS